MSILLSFRTMISAKRAKGLDARIGFRFGEDQYVALVKKGLIRVTKGPAGGADAIITTAPVLLAAGAMAASRSA